MKELLSEKLMHIVEIICFLENTISCLKAYKKNEIIQFGYKNV